MHAAFFSSWLSPPNEDFPEKHLLSSAGNVFGILESFMQDMFVENGQNFFFDTSQESIKVIMVEFTWIDHGYQDLMLNSQEFFQDVHFFVDQDILEKNDVV
jgi:hypothetical protein